MKNLAFHCLLRCKMILPILTKSLSHFLNLGVKGIIYSWVHFAGIVKKAHVEQIKSLALLEIFGSLVAKHLLHR